MFSSLHSNVTRGVAVIAVVGIVGIAGYAQPNPFRVDPNWAQLPEGRTWGAMSAADTGPDGGIWVAERCGQNSCVGRDDISPIHSFASSGHPTRHFGEGIFVWPHGIDVDHDGNVWVTDGRGEGGRGHQVFKFSPDGDLLMTLGTAGVAGNGPEHFNGPTDVVVAPNGDIFVSDGHEADGNNRVVKFSSGGRFLMTWGQTGTGPGEFVVPHALALDPTGRVFVADRDNNRIQIFDQDGNFLAEWRQFGRPSGIYIDPDGKLYVSDNQSNTERNRGWERGIRVGSATDGSVAAFIPDPEHDPDNPDATGAHDIAVDAAGNIYGAEVAEQTLRRYVRQ